MADDLCLSPTCKFNNHPLIFTLFFYDLSLLCSFIVSHPLYFSYFIFFSPYIFKFIFFISPLFFTSTAFFLLSVVATTFPHSKLGLVHTIVDKLRSKINEADEDEELRNFEEFEIYKIVFHDPPLIAVGDGDDQQVTVTENVVMEDTCLERLFEELDRFEDSTAAMVSISGEGKEAFQNSFAIKSNSWRLDSSSSFESYQSSEVSSARIQMTETKSSLEELTGELQKSEPLNISISGEVEETVRNSFARKSNSRRLDSFTSSESYESSEDSEAVNESNSGEDQKTVVNLLTVKSNSSRLMKVSTPEAVENQLQKLEPVTVSVPGEYQKTVQNSLSLKSNSSRSMKVSTQAATENKLQKLEPARVSISGEDQKTIENSWRSDSCNSFSSYGSMRKEKEWKRTLACKLFEERHNSEGGEEGMDSLWEAYENDNSSRKVKNTKESMNNQKKKKMMMMKIKNKNKSEFKWFDEAIDDDDEEEEDDELMNSGQLCCLKALKLSTGKMNLGMGKPNLVKISKAIKGFGWMYHVGSKNGKKV